MGLLIKNRHYKIAFGITAAVAAIMVVLQFAFSRSDVWSGFGVRGPVDEFFCECATLEAFFREPINTWSNIPFLFFSIVFLLTGIRDLRNYSRVNMMSYLPIYSFLFALGGLYIFASSTFFHMSLTTIGEHLDLSGVFFVALLPFVYNLHKAYNIQRFNNPVRTTKKTLKFFVGLFVLMIAGLTIFKWEMRTLVIVPILIGLTATSIIHMILRHPGDSDIRLLIISGFLLTVGATFFMLDNHSALCNENSFMQCHAIWHLCCSTAWFFLYLYLRSERVYSIYQLRVL